MQTSLINFSNLKLIANHPAYKTWTDESNPEYFLDICCLSTVKPTSMKQVAILVLTKKISIYPDALVRLFPNERFFKIYPVYTHGDGCFYLSDTITIPYDFDEPITIRTYENKTYYKVGKYTKPKLLTSVVGPIGKLP